MQMIHPVMLLMRLKLININGYRLANIILVCGLPFGVAVFLVFFLPLPFSDF